MTKEKDDARTALKKLNNNGKTKDLIEQANDPVKKIRSGKLDKCGILLAIHNLTNATAATTQSLLIFETKETRRKGRESVAMKKK